MQQGTSPLAIQIPRVRVVRKGHLVREGDVVVDSSSTVTLVEASRKQVIVDTGLARECDKLLFDLKAMRIDPKSVDVVINTHLHIDHCGCNDLFPNALVYSHQLEDPPVGNARISGALTLFPGVEIVPTPGHTRGSISVLVTAERKYAICGDAIPTKANYDAHLPPFTAFDKNLATTSMDFILEWAEIVVPGHDALFEVARKK